MARNAITWRNVQGPDLASATRPMLAAQQGINSAFDQLGGVLDEHNKGSREAATRAFQDRMAQIRTPEEMEAAMARGGIIDQLRSQYGQLIDGEVARNAPQAHLSALRNQMKEGWEYGHAKDDQINNPVFERIAELRYQGDHKA